MSHLIERELAMKLKDKLLVAAVLVAPQYVGLGLAAGLIASSIKERQIRKTNKEWYVRVRPRGTPREGQYTTEFLGPFKTKDEDREVADTWYSPSTIVTIE